MSESDRQPQVPRHGWLRNGNTPGDLRKVAPSRVFLRVYLPFFDQHAQSMTVWSPDSAAFAYAASNEAGEGGVWVQRLGQAPARVADGVFVAWSPR